MFVPIGGTFEINAMENRFGFSESFRIYPQWNSGRTGLEIRYHGSGRWLDKPRYYTYTGTLRYTAIGNELISFDQDHVKVEIDGDIREFNGWTECTYTRD